MSVIAAIGVDLAQNVSQLNGMDETGNQNDDTVIGRLSEHHIVTDRNEAEPSCRLSSGAFNVPDGPRVGLSID